MSRDYTVYYSFGGGWLPPRFAQQAQTGRGYPAQRIEFASSGAGVRTVGKRGLVVGTEGHAIVDEDVSHGYESALGLGYQLVNLGYLFRVRGVRVYPVFGVGALGYALNITDRANTNRAEVRLSRSSFLLNLGLGAELQIGGRYGITIGLRAGYIIAPFARREGIRGPYVRLVFGGHVGQVER